MASAGIDVVHIPPIPREILLAFTDSENPWVRSVDRHIDLLNKQMKNLPLQYKWRFRDTNAFTARVHELVKTAKDALELNQFAWRDHLASCEAYSLLTTWRNIDLVKGGVWAIARGEVVTSAVLARSAIETAAQLADMARKTMATLAGETKEKGKGRLLDPELDLHANRVVSQDFENLILKTLYATRLPGTEEFYNATNIFSIIQQTAKIPGQELVLKMYENLCEVAHPNFIGKSLYLLDFKPGSIAGEELRTIGPGNGPSSREIVETSLGALSWACGTNASAFDLMSNTIHAVATRLELIK